MDLLLNCLRQLASIADWTFTLLAHIVPSKESLSDVAAFEGVLIGVAIPISLRWLLGLPIDIRTTK